jgi:hypothetical protein
MRLLTCFKPFAGRRGGGVWFGGTLDRGGRFGPKLVDPMEMRAIARSHLQGVGAVGEDTHKVTVRGSTRDGHFHTIDQDGFGKAMVFILMLRPVSVLVRNFTTVAKDKFRLVHEVGEEDAREMQGCGGRATAKGGWWISYKEFFFFF